MTVFVTATHSLVPSTSDIVDQVCFSDSSHSHPVAKLKETRFADEVVPRPLARRIDRFSILALTSVNCLLAQSRLRGPTDRVGVFVGNMLGGWSYGEPQLLNLIAKGFRAVEPYQATAWFPAAAQGEITIKFQFQGAAKTTSGGESCGLEALLLATDALESSDVDYAVCGCAESLLSPFATWGYCGGCPDPGLVVGEGAAFLLLSRQCTGLGVQIELGNVPQGIERNRLLIDSNGRAITIPGVDFMLQLVAKIDRLGVDAADELHLCGPSAALPYCVKLRRERSRA